MVWAPSSACWRFPSVVPAQVGPVYRVRGSHLPILYTPGGYGNVVLTASRRMTPSEGKQR